MKAFAKFISYAFHPLMVVSYLLIIYWWKLPYFFSIALPLQAFYIVVYTLFLPAWAIFLLKRIGLVSSIEMDEKKERIIPLIIVMTFYLWAYMAFNQAQLPVGMIIFVLGAVITLFICFFINIFNKISLHMAAFSGLVLALAMQIAYFGFDFRFPLLIVIILTGVIAWARLTIGAHDLKQIYSGLLVGAISQTLALFIYPLVN